MKSDLLEDSEINESDVLDSIQGLINVCKARCLSFKIIFVSSVGKVGPNESPPKTLTPKNVAEPMIWSIRNIHF